MSKLKEFYVQPRYCDGLTGSVALLTGKIFYCLLFLTSWFTRCVFFCCGPVYTDYSWTPFSSVACHFIIFKINHRHLAIRTRELEIVRSNWSSWQENCKLCFSQKLEKLEHFNGNSWLFFNRNFFYLKTWQPGRNFRFLSKMKKLGDPVSKI